MVFWSVSDFSYPNHIHVTEVAPLLGRRSSFCFGWSLSSMFACFCTLHPSHQIAQPYLYYTASFELINSNKLKLEAILLIIILFEL